MCFSHFKEKKNVPKLSISPGGKRDRHINISEVSHQVCGQQLFGPLQELFPWLMKGRLFFVATHVTMKEPPFMYLIFMEGFL